MALIETVRAERLVKIERMKEVGMEAYPSHSGRTHSVEQFLENHRILEKNSEEVILAGRVMSIREHGGSLFVDIFDGTIKAQVYFKKENLKENAFEQFLLFVDTGDIIEIGGVAFSTKRGILLPPSFLIRR